jgi:acetoin utilization deacetylase AcuC-like enzyme
MKILFNKIFLDHNIDSQYEGAYRLNNFKDIEDTTIDGEKWISLVHPESYRDTIKKACQNREVIAEVQLSPESYKAVCIAVGLSVKASETGHFAVVRPPGHHASFDKPSGFCLFNNIAIATQKLLNEGKRVLLLDIDGHHGDGTQHIFYKSNKVLFCSIHQEYAYPFTGFVTERGEGEGEGFTLNFPLMTEKGDKDFLDRIDKVIEQAREFKPDIIGVSAGFDAYEKDKLLQLNYSKHAYYECAYRLKKNFRGTPIFGVLEGGYHEDLRELVDAFVEGINKGRRPPKIVFNEDMAIG